MPTFDFIEEDRPTLADLARQTIREEWFPMSPRLAPLKSALAKLDPVSVPIPRKELPSLPVWPDGGEPPEGTTLVLAHSTNWWKGEL